MARAVPRPILEQFCLLLEGLPPEADRAATGAALRSVSQQAARDALAELVSFWRRRVPGVRPDQLAWALRAASITDEDRRRQQSVELVWTGPVVGPSTLRRTEQARLYHWYTATGEFPPRRPKPGSRPVERGKCRSSRIFTRPVWRVPTR